MSEEVGGLREDRADRSLPDGITSRWTCPICGKSRVGIADTKDERMPIQQAKNALTSHILATEGDGHGSHHSMPDAFDIERLDDYVKLEPVGRKA